MDRRHASDELARWAATRGPALLAKAEAQAVEALRDALVTAALASRDRATPAPGPRAPEAEREPTEQGELLWAYCVLRARDPQPEELPGVDRDGAVERVQADDLAMLVSRVPRAEFAAEPLRRHLGDLPWLEATARAHEAVLDSTLAMSTIVPLRMCTMYENADSARRMLDREHKAFIQALDAVDGRLEWAVKVIVADGALLDAARARLDPGPPEEGLAAHGEGGAYMLRRRRERRVRELAGALSGELAEQVHARLQDWAIDAVTRPPQNPELSGHEGEMVLNAAYLVDRTRTDELRRLVAELEQHHRELGARIELTGPWPPYNFVPGGGAATLA